jgi:soluble lytic murein transglycosylase
VQERLRVSGLPRLRWLRILLRLAIVCVCIVPIGIDPFSNRASGVSYAQDSARLPYALQEWDRLDSFTATEPLKTLKRGLEAYFSERYGAAIESLGDDLAAKTALGDYLLFYRAKSNLLLDRKTEALADFQKLEARYPDSSQIRDALLLECQIYLALTQPKAALALLGNSKISPSAETMLYEARAWDMAGEKQKAEEIFLRIYSRYPASRQSSLAEQYLAAKSPGAFKGARNYAARLQRAEVLIASADYRAARIILLALGKVTAPSTVLSEKRDLQFGQVEHHLGRSLAAIPFFRKVSSSDPAAHAKALYFEGVCLRKLQREQELIALRDRILKLYPRSPDAEELCYSVATHLDVSYDAARAREDYALLYSCFPKGKYAERALWKLALYPYFEKRYEEAALGFWKYLQAYPSPSSASSAMYWLGRCYQKLGDMEDAKYLYRHTRALSNEGYYGQRAREAELSLEKAADKGPVEIPGIDATQAVSRTEAIQLPTMQFGEPNAAGLRVITRARQLVSIGFPDLALAELRSGRTQHPGSDCALSYVIARIYSSKRDYDSAIVALKKALPDYNSYPISTLPGEVWEVLFPVRHWGIISEQASKLKIDPTLVLGLIRQESAFEENARSKANARGLMQVLPSTGNKLAKQARITRYSAKKLYQAETNIILGTRYFASILQQFGKAELALAAYNAGDSRVERWLQEFGNVDMAEFVEQIPFAETRGYVKQVLSNRVHYNLLTSPSAPAAR